MRAQVNGIEPMAVIILLQLLYVDIYRPNALKQFLSSYPLINSLPIHAFGLQII